jgi:nitroreductase
MGNLGSENGCWDVAKRTEMLRQVITHRRSCRKFKSEQIPMSDLWELAEAGVWAPSGSNAQNQRFLVIDDRKEIERIGELRWMVSYTTRLSDAELKERFPYGLIGGATALILVFADAALNNCRNNGEYYLWETLETQNCAASVQNILLMASAKGIGSCWVSATEHMNYSRLLTGHNWRQVLHGYDLPPSCKIQGLIMLGWPVSTDEFGYPRGEGMHGVVNQPTARGPLDQYLVKRTGAGSAVARPRRMWRVRLLRRGIEVLLRMVAYLDRRIYRLEIGE